MAGLGERQGGDAHLLRGRAGGGLGRRRWGLPGVARLVIQRTLNPRLIIEVGITSVDSVFRDNTPALRAAVELETGLLLAVPTIGTCQHVRRGRRSRRPS